MSRTCSDVESLPLGFYKHYLLRKIAITRLDWRSFKLHLWRTGVILKKHEVNRAMQCQKHPPSFQISSNFNSRWWRASSGTPSAPAMTDALGLPLRCFMLMPTTDKKGLTVQPSGRGEVVGKTGWEILTFPSVFSELHLPLNLHGSAN